MTPGTRKRRRSSPGRLIGVEVENHGPVGAEVRIAGIDIDYVSQRGPWQYTFFPNNYTGWQFLCRVDGHSTRAWFDNERQIRRSVNRHFTDYGAIPRRFRAWAGLGNGDLLLGDWVPRADLPIWEPGLGEAELRILFGESPEQRSPSRS